MKFFINLFFFLLILLSCKSNNKDNNLNKIENKKSEIRYIIIQRDQTKSAFMVIEDNSNALYINIEDNGIEKEYNLICSKKTVNKIINSMKFHLSPKNFKPGTSKERNGNKIVKFLIEGTDEPFLSPNNESIRREYYDIESYRNVSNNYESLVWYLKNKFPKAMKNW